MGISQLLLILLARKRMVLLVLGVTVAVTLLLSLVWPKSYEAEVQIVLDSKGTDPLTGMVMPTQMIAGYMATQMDIIGSHSVALKVVDHLHLTDVPLIKEQFNEATNGEGSIRDWLADKLLKHLDVKPARESSMISIQFSGRDAQFAADLANAFAESYIQTALELQIDPARRQAGWFDDQVQNLRDSLEKAQQRLSSFQHENNMVGADEQRLDIENAKLADISNQLIAAQAVTYDSMTRLNQMNKAAGNQESLQQLPDILGNTLLQNMKADLVRAEGRLADTAQRYDLNHPQYVSAAAEVATLKAKLATEINTARGSINQTAQLAKQREGELQAAFDRQKAHILELQQLRDQQAVLTREVDNAQHTYDAAMQRSSQVKLESRLDQTNIAILNPAIPPLKPARPKVLLNLVLSIFIGGILAAVSALLAELQDRRLRSSFDLSNVLGVTVLAELPPFSDKDIVIGARLLDHAHT